MKAYYYDNLDGDQRAPHFSGELVPADELERLGLFHQFIPLDGREESEWTADINQVASERGYKNRDVINVSKTGLGDIYEEKIKSFFHEHLHEDEEIRFILEGSGYFDVKTAPPQERWIRVAMEKGDLLVLPPGIYHRFTLDLNDSIKAMRLFKDEPKWTPYNRSEEVDDNPYRQTYLSSLQA